MTLLFILIPAITLALVIASPFVLIALIKADSRRYHRKAAAEFGAWLDGDRKHPFYPSEELRSRHPEFWERRDQELRERS